MENGNRFSRIKQCKKAIGDAYVIEILDQLGNAKYFRPCIRSRVVSPRVSPNTDT